MLSNRYRYLSPLSPSRWLMTSTLNPFALLSRLVLAHRAWCSSSLGCNEISAGLLFFPSYTGGVGQKSNLCTSIKAKNPEIAALTQRQDPASDGATATNKAITLELAEQNKSFEGDPLVRPSPVPSLLVVSATQPLREIPRTTQKAASSLLTCSSRPGRD